MSLKTDMAADLMAVFLDDGAFADAGEYYPRGSTNHFPVKLVLGDIATASETLESGIVESQRSCQAVGSRAVIRAGILAALGNARDPVRGDTVVIAAGENAGTWSVAAPAATDVGGGLMIDLVRDKLGEVAGPGVVEVRS